MIYHQEAFGTQILGHCKPRDLRTVQENVILQSHAEKVFYVARVDIFISQHLQLITKPRFYRARRDNVEILDSMSSPLTSQLLQVDLTLSTVP